MNKLPSIVSMFSRPLRFCNELLLFITSCPTLIILFKDDRSFILVEIGTVPEIGVKLPIVNVPGIFVYL